MVNPKSRATGGEENLVMRNHPQGIEPGASGAVLADVEVMFLYVLLQGITVGVMGQSPSFQTSVRR